MVRNCIRECPLTSTFQPWHAQSSTQAQTYMHAHTPIIQTTYIHIIHTHTQMSTSSVNSWHFTAKHSVSFCLACGVPPFLYYLYNALYLATEARESLDRFWPLLSLHKFFFFHTMLCTFIFFL